MRYTSLMVWVWGLLAGCTAGPRALIDDRGQDATVFTPDGSAVDASAPDGSAVDSSADAAPGDGGLRRGALRGAFLQVLNAPPASHWTSAVSAMHALGMDTVIVQTEGYLRTNGSVDKVSRDRITAVLDEADRYGMVVWIGLVLAEDGNGSPAAAADEGFVERVIGASEASALRLRDDFGSHPAFGGWYLPIELWTPGPGASIGLLGDYVRRVSQHCHALRAGDIAISPFISDAAIDPAATETTFRDVLATSAVTVVMLQDGVGARGVPTAEIQARVSPYLEAMGRACVAPGCTLWANVESFAPGGDPWRPAEFDRFREQLTVASASTPHLVTFEYATYWLPGGKWDAQSRALHDSYAAWLSAP